VKSGDVVFQEDLALRFYDCCSAERRLCQLLQIVFGFTDRQGPHFFAGEKPEQKIE
jgi:hypothetical protein